MADNKFPADEEIIDLTDIIETGESSAKKATSSSSASDMDKDFDDILAEAGGNDSADIHPVDADEQLDMSGMGDIDNLLESLDIPVQPGSPASAPQPAASRPSPEKSVAMEEPEESSSPDPAFNDLDSVLDDLLGDSSSRPAAPRQSAPPQPVETPEAGHKESDMPDMDADLDSILMEAEQSAPASVSKSEDMPLKSHDLPESQANDENLLTDSISVSMDNHSGSSIDDILNDIPDSGASETSFEEKLIASQNSGEQGETSTSGTLQVQPAMQSYSPELIAGICGNVLTNQANATQESLRDISHRLGSQTAHMEDLARQVDDLSKRLKANEAKLSSAKARIASLEKSQERFGSLEDLLRDGSPLHAGFMALLSTAVSNAISTALASRDEFPVMRDSIQSIDNRCNGIDARMDNLDKRLDDLEPRFNEGIEKAAAKAVVKILHEEISKLAQDS